MLVLEFLVVAGLCCTILPCYSLGQNSEVSSRNSAVAEDGKVTVNFGDLVIEVRPPRGREGIVNAEPIYERWENVDDVTYWESIYGSMDDIPAFEDLPDIQGETVELKSVKQWDEEDPEEKPTEITDKDQSRDVVKNSSSRSVRSPRLTSEPEITTKNSNRDRCERINPLFTTFKSLNRQRREINVSQEEEADAEEAIKNDPNRKRKSRTLSLLQSFGGKSRSKSNRWSDYLFNKYGRRGSRPYEYERGISGRFVDDCVDVYGITGAAGSTKFVDSAINAVELVNSGIAKTSQMVTGTIVNGAKQLAQAKRDAIDLGQEATQDIALGSLNNGAADCREEGIGAAVATNIDSGLEVVGNSVLDTNSGIINAAMDTVVPVGITASLDARSKAEVDAAVGSALNNESAVGAEIISNAVVDSNVAITDDKDTPEEIAGAKSEGQIDSEEAEIVGERLVAEEVGEEPSVAEEIGRETLDAEEIGGETLDAEEIDGETLDAEEIGGETLDAEEIGGEPLDAEKIGGENLDAEEIVGETLDAEEIGGETLDAEKIGGETLDAEKIGGETLDTEEIVGGTFVPEEIAEDATSAKTPILEPAIVSQAAREAEILSGAEPSVGSALKVNAESGLHTSINLEISTGSKAEVKDHKNEPNQRVLGRHDLSHKCADSLENDRDQEFYPRRRYYDEFEDYREYRRRFPDRSRYRPNSQHHHGKPRSGIHANTEIESSLDTKIGLNSIRRPNANLDIRNVGSGIHADTSVHSSLNSALDIGSHHHGTDLPAGAKSALDVDSHLDSGRSRSNYRFYDSDRERFRNPEEPDSAEEDIYDFDSEEYREFKQRFFDTRSRGHSLTSGSNANTGIHSSLDSDVDVKTGLRGDGINSGIYSSGVHSSRDTEGGLNRNAAGSHLHAGSRASLDAKSRPDVGRINSARPNGRYSWEDISAEYDDYDDERDYGTFAQNRYRDGQRGVQSGVHSTSGIHGSVGPGVGINEGSAGGLQAGAKTSLNRDSHLDIGSTTSAVSAANARHFLDAINSAIRADTGLQIETDVNAAGHSDGGMKSSLLVDSHLDVGSRTNGAPGAAPRSEIIGDVNGPDGELGEKICEAAYRGSSDFRKHDYCPHSRFEPNGHDGPSYICDSCRRRLHSGAHNFCPNCGELNDVFAERLPFLSSGTIYHFDVLKQNCKRTADSSEDIEPHPETTCGFKSYINLDANCTDEAFQRNPDCQNLDYNLQMPRDGNPVSLGIVRTHLSHGHDIALDMHDRARSLVAGGLHPYPHTASMLHFFHSKVPDDLVKLNEESELTLFGTKLLQHKLSVDHDITPNNFLEFLNHHGFRVTGDRICRGRHKRCGGYDKFRSLDGSCNNVAHPTWGQSNRAFARILPARYSDGIHGMPVSVTGAELPNPRKLSVRLYSRSTKLDPELTLAVMQWGQTLAHDLGRQVMDQTTSGGIECCADNGKRHLPKSLQHHSCAPITISPRDKFYSIHGQRCMNFVRAMTVTREDCTLGPADQLNAATSFLDCSSMYGPDKVTSNELREFTGGRMKVEFRSGRWMLPTTTNQSNFCDIWTSDDVCYRTGDPRNNQNPQLVILQTMLVREHNRIADGLKALNAAWNDERIFQESRRIVIAEYQHITYNEWLPLLLGRRYVKKHGLNRTESGMSSAYNERINPTTIIGFTSGAFRSLHSMIEGDIGLCNVGGEIIDSLRLSDHFFRPKVIENKNNFEHLLRGLASQRMQAQDMNLHRELTEYLFRSRNDYGMDLAAIDIQRGRDHGVPSYNAYRKICRLEPADDFDDLSEEISWENIEKLRRDYAHVDDIDLIVGATMENRSPGSLFGPTNRCLIGEQFYRSRVGDRYFYDNANLPHSFTPEQFHEITKVTLSRLMCDMGGAVVMVQRNAFRATSSKNPLVACQDLPKLDLSLWME